MVRSEIECPWKYVIEMSCYRLFSPLCFNVVAVTIEAYVWHCQDTIDQIILFASFRCCNSELAASSLIVECIHWFDVYARLAAFCQ